MMRSKSGRSEKHPGARGPPLKLEMERSAYLLCPGPGADRGQMQPHLPSSSNSSSVPGRRTIFLGKGLGVTGDGEEEGGGGANFPSICNLTFDNSSLCSDKPGLPRSSARLTLTNLKTTSPFLPDLARGKDGSATLGPAEQIPGDYLHQDQLQPSWGPTDA